MHGGVGQNRCYWDMHGEMEEVRIGAIGTCMERWRRSE